MNKNLENDIKKIIKEFGSIEKYNEFYKNTKLIEKDFLEEIEKQIEKQNINLTNNHCID